MHIINKLILITAFTIAAAHSWAHVPYLEKNDFSAMQPFKVEYSIEQSLAIYAWLDNNHTDRLEDIDIYETQMLLR